jgi:Holliday junction resolvasome RuvABC endonuclease subunit
MKVMGVDLGIRKIAYSVWDDWLLTHTEAFTHEGNSRGEELEEVSNFLTDAVRLHQVDHVFIEETLLGNNVKYSIQLAQMMGACLANLHLVTLDMTLGVYTVNVSTWKKEVLRNGNASKDLIQKHITSIDSAYAVLCGYDQDRFDAACIGYYGTLIADRALEVSG